VTLEEIAKGTKAADPAGFAREYAARALARIDGKKPPAPPRRRLTDGLRGLPGDPCLLAMIDSGGAGPAAEESQAPTLFRKTLSTEEKEALYKDVEQIGNLQMDRITVAFFTKKENGNVTFTHAVARVSGKGNRAWVVDALRKEGIDFKVQQAGAKEPVAVWSQECGTIALTGNLEMVYVIADQAKNR
jgi:hypothetical protein